MKVFRIFSRSCPLFSAQTLAVRRQIPGSRKLVQTAAFQSIQPTSSRGVSPKFWNSCRAWILPWSQSPVQESVSSNQLIMMNPQIHTHAENQNRANVKPKSWVICDKMGKERKPINMTAFIPFLSIPKKYYASDKFSLCVIEPI